MAYLPTNDITTSGSIATLNGTVALNLNGQSGATVQVTGTWVATLQFEGTLDGTTWIPINAVAASTSGPIPVTTVNGLYRVTPAGLTTFRINATAYTSGTAVITMRASLGVGGTFINQIAPIKITDGTSTTTIKPASTASLTTDLPLVVALHPSSPTPNFLAAQSVTGTRLNNGTSNSAGSFHLTIGGSDGTNLRPLLVDTGGRPFIKISDGTNITGITAAGIAGNELTVDRLKVNASLRMVDSAQSAGSQLVAAKGDQTTGLWVNIKNTTVPVTGTFFQATQPVSLATNTPDVTDRASRVLGVISATNLDVALSTRLKPTDTLAAVTLISDTRQTVPANLQMTATPIVITKGTQSTTGFTTQDLKDAGRNQVHFYTIIPVLSTATDTLQILTGTKAGLAVIATATPAVVTTGKIFRVTRLAATYIATAVSGYGIVRLRFNTAGVVTINSPIAATLLVGAGAPTTANSTASEEAALDEGWEFAAATGVGISVQGFAAVTPTAVGYVLVSVTGYEY